MRLRGCYHCRMCAQNLYEMMNVWSMSPPSWLEFLGRPCEVSKIVSFDERSDIVDQYE